MTINQLLYFRQIALEQHFTKAAEQLFVSQSSLSHAIISLENELGVSLFVRKSGKKVSLTESGKALLVYAEKILNSVDEAQRAMEALRNPAGGVVRVEYSFINGFELVPQALRAFSESRQSKDIVLRYSINHALRKIEWDLRDGNLDIAFTSARHFEGLYSWPITVQEVYAYVPASRPYAARDRVSLRELADESIIIYNKLRHLHKWIMAMYAYSGLTPVFADEIKEDWAEQITAVAMNEGIIISPSIPYDPALVRRLRIDHPMSRRCLYMHWAANRELSPAVQTAVDFFKAYFLQRNGGKPIEEPFAIPEDMDVD